MAASPEKLRRWFRARAALVVPAVAALACLLAFAAAGGAAPDRRQDASTRPSRVAAAGSRAETAQSEAPVPPRGSSSISGNGKIARRKPPTTGPTTKPAARVSTTGFEPTRVVVALAVVIGLIALLRWVGRRVFGVAGPGRSTRAVQVLSRSPLSPKQNLVLIRVGRRLLVVADGGGAMNTLSEITDADEVAALLGQLQDDHNDRAIKTFGNLFGKKRGDFEREAESDSANGEPDGDARNLEDPDGAPDDVRLRPTTARGREGDDDEGRAVESTRQELSGLMDKVRLLSRQFKSP